MGSTNPTNCNKVVGVAANDQRFCLLVSPLEPWSAGDVINYWNNIRERRRIKLPSLGVTAVATPARKFVVDGTEDQLALESLVDGRVLLGVIHAAFLLVTKVLAIRLLDIILEDGVSPT